MVRYVIPNNNATYDTPYIEDTAFSSGVSQNILKEFYMVQLKHLSVKYIFQFSTQTFMLGGSVAQWSELGL